MNFYNLINISNHLFVAIAENFNVAARPKLNEIVDQVFFQDNSLVFKELLNLKGKNAIIYPPGFGKTTMAKLYEAYASDIQHDEKIESWLRTCEFAKKYAKEYEDNHNAHKVIYISFADIESTSEQHLETDLANIVCDLCFNYANRESYLEMREWLLAHPERYALVLHHLIRQLTFSRDEGKKTFILLDSCDTLYNVPVQFPGETGKTAIKQLNSLLNFDGIENTVTIYFGVSPFFTNEIRGFKKIFSVRTTSDDFHKCFSYSEESIERVIHEWNLNVDQNNIIEMAEFRFIKNKFIVPELVVKLLESLRRNDYIIKTEINPKSVWLETVFGVTDPQLLRNALISPFTIKSSLTFSIRDIINFKQMAQKHALKKYYLFYPLFIFGGFFSCLETIRSQNYEPLLSLTVANGVMKLILDKIIRQLVDTEEELFKDHEKL